MGFRNGLGITLLLLLLIAFLGGGCVSGVFGATEEVREAIAAPEGSDLTVANQNGSINIRGWDRDYVDLVAVKKSMLGAAELRNVEIFINQSGGQINVETEYLKKNARVSVSYEIRVPSGVTVSRVDSSNGSIEVRDVSGNLYAETSNGRILVEAVTGLQEARTSNGSISAEIPRISGETRIKTSNGSIDLYLAENLDSDLEAQTANGKINVHGLVLALESVSSTSLKGKLGGGGPLIDIATSNGSVDLYILHQGHNP